MYTGCMTTRKQCRRCEKTRLTKFFNAYPRNRDGLQSYCKDCQREMVRESYARNPERYRHRAKETREKNRRLMQERKQQPCADCERALPYWVMQFDHKPGTTKRKTFMAQVAAIGKKPLLEEIDKCEVVCATCHANRTYWRQRNLPIKKISFS